MPGFLSPGLVGTDLETLLPVSPLGAAENGRQKRGEFIHLTGKKCKKGKTLIGYIKHNSVVTQAKLDTI